MKTTYIVQGFDWHKIGKDTRLMGDMPLMFKTEHEALIRAEKLSDKRAGVIAAKQEYDEETGEYGEVKILVRYGEVPPELGED